ncbi:ferritin-like domain-containing protein [Campylobacter insulaenigrae]|uniref:ferritin-like domain-containing protein n=1 Tax=Campylobacter insulaenigrae TaxID=260714 RepID=UPI002152365A|nr:ferritin-like domain-containing protein [Campylobacter insulaenigrae]MCR6585058.1 ferritin-like domain-containing protein [Campylobacter insulaenigrae]
MRINFFTNLEKILYEKNINTKIDNFKNFYENFKLNLCDFNHNHKAIIQENIQVKILHPTKIRRPKQANSTLALAKIIHSIAHIEYSAINLALDASYRFKNLPYNFYKDWLEVADEEIKHFLLLEKILNELGFKYGDFSAHDNLEQALFLTKDSLTQRMGIVHRGLEAKGLDANPFVLKKLNSSNHPIKILFKDIFKIILEDEIKHVNKGNIWWEFAKDEKDDYISLCRNFKEFSLIGKQYNKEARIKAGFKQYELDEMEKLYNKNGG